MFSCEHVFSALLQPVSLVSCLHAFISLFFPQHSCPVIKVMNATATVLTFACKPWYAACLC